MLWHSPPVDNLSIVTSYCDVYSQHKAEHENEDIPNIHLTAEEPPLDPSTNKYSERETHMLDHQVRSVSLPQQQGDQYMSVQLSHTHWLIVPLMLWTMIIVQHHHQPRYRSA